MLLRVADLYPSFFRWAELGAEDLLEAAALGPPIPAWLAPPAARLLLVVFVNAWT